MWLLSGILACADFWSARVMQADLVTVGDCKSDDDAVALYLDGDGDGYGDGDVPSAWGCLPVEGYVDVGGDCADGDPNVAPGMPEACNGVDDDCDFTVDEAPDRLWCQDSDEDGFGNPDAAQVHACDQPSHYVEDCSDCDDDDAAINPDATEVIGDGVDQDCDDVAQ